MQLQDSYPNTAFKVYNKPYCLWGADLPQRNLEAIDSIEPEYFEFLATIYHKELQSEHKQKAALAIRAAYGLALETLFSLICAIIQAPFCFYAWMLKYRPSDVPKIINEIGNYNFHLHLSPVYKVKISSWEDFSSMIHLVHKKKENKEIAIKFGEFWRKLSHDFLDEKFRNEYNSIKHGCRVKSGGCSIAIGKEEMPGVVAPRENMKSLGGSEFGSSFFLAQEIKGIDIKGEPNFKTRRLTVNWDAENNAHALTLISLSIHNIKSFLKYSNSIEEEVVFMFPEEIEYFKMPWKNHHGILSCSLDLDVDDTEIIKKTCEDVESILRKVQDKKVND